MFTNLERGIVEISKAASINSKLVCCVGVVVSCLFASEALEEEAEFVFAGVLFLTKALAGITKFPNMSLSKDNKTSVSVVTPGEVNNTKG